MERGAAVSEPTPVTTDAAELLVDGDLWFGDSTASDARHEQWLDVLFSRPAERLVSNVRTEWALLRAGEAMLPVTINDNEFENSYVCSPYTGCVLYPRSELDKLRGHPVVTAAIRALLLGMQLPLKLGRINRVACVNNWLLSTNLYPEFDATKIPQITQLLVNRYPTHAIAFRSLNEVTNDNLLRRLKAAGYLLAPSRQVYFFDAIAGNFERRPNSRWDRALLSKTRFHIVHHDEINAADVPRIERLYRLLYVEKYSPHNPQFSVEFLEECRRRRLLNFVGLRNDDGRLEGVVGSFNRAGVMTVPIVGYDTSLPQRLGLYRMLMALVMREAAERRLLLNLSSGAAEFKRLRGGTPHLEYTAVYCRHLSWPSRIVWQALAALLQYVGSPILQKYRL
jgi:hypothetical protein